MKHHFQNLVSLTVALLVAIVAIPLMTEAQFHSQDQDGILLDNSIPNLADLAKKDASAQRLRSRSYFDAMEVYRDMVSKGAEGLVKPDFNDPQTVAFYTQKREPTGEHAAPPNGGTTSRSTLTADQLSDEARTKLYQAERSRYCSQSLKSYMPGFYELCVSLVGKGRYLKPRTGFGNDLATVKRVKNTLPNTMNSRLEMLRQAREGTKRESTAPMRTAAPTQ